MSRISKSIYAVTVTIIFLYIGNISALPAPTASVPEFTVQYIDRSYTIQATTTMDPFTGKTVTNPAQYTNNKTIQVSIKYQVTSGIAFKQYDIRLKNHYMQEWSNISSIKADTNCTVLTFAIGGNNATGNFTGYLDGVLDGDTVDFQVQEELWIQRLSGDLFHLQRDYVLWEASDWSNTQSITIPENNSSSPTPIVPEFSWLVILPLLISLLFVVFSITLYRRHRKTNNMSK